VAYILYAYKDYLSKYFTAQAGSKLFSTWTCNFFPTLTKQSHAPPLFNHDDNDKVSNQSSHSHTTNHTTIMMA
jgi:hypothetical protein